jgi:hypothetical protein
VRFIVAQHLHYGGIVSRAERTLTWNDDGPACRGRRLAIRLPARPLRYGGTEPKRLSNASRDVSGGRRRSSALISQSDRVTESGAWVASPYGDGWHMEGREDTIHEMIQLLLGPNRPVLVLGGLTGSTRARPSSLTE